MKTRRLFGQEFRIEAVKLVTDRGVAVSTSPKSGPRITGSYRAHNALGRPGDQPRSVISSSARPAPEGYGFRG